MSTRFPMPPRNESAAKRALQNKNVQRTQDEFLAAFLANRNRETPNSLKHSSDGADGQETNVRRRGEVRSTATDFQVSAMLWLI